MPAFGESTFPARLLGAVDIFIVWWVVSLSIGVGVLYKKRTGPIASAFLALYLVIALVLAVVRS